MKLIYIKILSIIIIIISFYKYNQNCHIIIGGGGITCIMTSIELAKIYNCQITLLEAKYKLLQGVSKLCFKAHGGYEYPNHMKSSSDCLIGLIDWLEYFKNEKT